LNKRDIVSEKTGPGGTDPRSLLGAEFMIAAAALDQLPPPGPPEVAFASRTPGRTQQIVMFGLPSGAIVADLPGYGYAAVPKAVKLAWQDVLATYVATRSTLVALVLVVDARHGLKPLDLAMLDGFLPSGRPVMVLATKSDKLTRTESARASAAIRGQLAERYPGQAPHLTVVPFSATARTGLMEADAILGRWLAG